VAPQAKPEESEAFEEEKKEEKEPVGKLLWLTTNHLDV
jgi:hypothetical protein